MLKLYEHPLSAFVMKVKMALNEKGLAYEAIAPSGLMDGSAGGDFVDASPRGEIPALIDDGVHIFDSTIILEYLEDKWPQPPLLPQGAAERARMRMIEDVMDTQYEANNWVTMEVSAHRRATGAQAEAMIAHARRSIEQLQRWLDRQLGDRHWFNGDAFGWGDIAVAPVFARSTIGYGYPPVSPRLQAWFDRASARPAVARVLDQLRAALANLPDFVQLRADGKIKRQYRDHRLEWMIAAGGLSVVQDGISQGSIRFSRLPQ
jgi:glutathione S-transferase/RNA polymerase-associated protein